MGRTRHSNTVYSFRQAEADFTMWGSGSRFSKNYGPIVEDQKSNPMYITKNCVQNYVSIVVSTVQENSSQSSSFINPQYLSLDFVGKTALRYLCHISLTSQKRYLQPLPIFLPKVCTSLLLTDTFTKMSLKSVRVWEFIFLKCNRANVRNPNKQVTMWIWVTANHFTSTETT